MSLGEHVVGIATLDGVERVEREIVDDEQVGGDEPSQLGVVAVVEARVLERPEHLVGTHREHRQAATARDVTERVGDEGLTRIGNVRNFAAIWNRGEPRFQIRFIPANPYRVQVVELSFNQEETFTLPLRIVAP